MRLKIDGVLVVDKPPGITSMEVVREIKRRFRLKKVGHLGTLDPFATGVLPIVINDGTKVVPFLEEEPKEYEAVLRLGEETRTDDPTGEVISRTVLEGVTPEAIQCVFESFVGRIEQRPPMFSAVKVQGKPLYSLARMGIEIDRKMKKVNIFDLKVEKIALPQVHFRVSCSKGTYVRTLARDIGEKLGCGAHLLQLRRIRSGFFTLPQALSLESLKSFSGLQDLRPRLLLFGDVLRHLPGIVSGEPLLEKVRFGREMVVRDLCTQALPAFGKGQWIRILSPNHELVAILRSEVEGTDIHHLDPDRVALRPVRVFQAPRRPCSDPCATSDGGRDEVVEARQ